MVERAMRRWYVISLRPQGEHGALRRAAARVGARTVALSPWKLVPLEDAHARAALEAALAAPRVVFTSPAAVRAAARLAALRRRRAQAWCAVGAGTAAALRRAGLEPVAVPERMDSEGLLALPELRDVRGIAVGLVTAPGGRDAIAPALRARGAQVRRADVYRRLPLPPSPRTLARLRALDAPAVLVASSGEALERTMQALPADLAARLRAGPLVVASARLAERARALGFADIRLARGPRPADLVAAAAG
ncbi:uroporphyrinogen-III synthase [Vulcaniibacterium thermophilum]|uniref:Uroporphyrinogen-III synthase n=2 Tax=Vulcaniibacterium thermophilum TaxID=1169913 RepID=A0A919DBB1_9GAMM|nr:uroporphyrinogen III methyltransferase [Vulcaniibacterium thermophilum]